MFEENDNNPLERENIQSNTFGLDVLRMILKTMPVWSHLYPCFFDTLLHCSFWCW